MFQTANQRFMFWCVSVRILVFQCSYFGMSVFVFWCVSVRILVCQCSYFGVPVFVFWCVSVRILVCQCSYFHTQQKMENCGKGFQ
jgi:hypothetical protein